VVASAEAAASAAAVVAAPAAAEHPADGNHGDKVIMPAAEQRRGALHPAAAK